MARNTQSSRPRLRRLQKFNQTPKKKQKLGSTPSTVALRYFGSTAHSGEADEGGPSRRRALEGQGARGGSDLRSVICWGVD